MRLRRGRVALAAATIALALPTAVSAHTSTLLTSSSDGAGLTSGNDAFHNFTLRSASPYSADTSSDIAFWGDRAFVGNYDGFRIFDISGRIPRLLREVNCPGAQGDPSVWDRDGDGNADLLILSVDRTMEGPDCGEVEAAHDDPSGWEGLRIFDVSDPANAQQIATVYQDCGSHTNTLVPRVKEGRLLVLNSSYPLRPGPTCGPVRGPEADRDPLHGVIQVVEVPLDDPTGAKEITELPVVYPGDSDNKYLPVSEHGLKGTGLIDGMRACHDLGVFIEAGLVGAACGEQAQVWRLDRRTGLPDTENPLWVYDQDNVDFWHSATFSWDGKIVNFIDESFGDNCPTTTIKTARQGQTEREYQTGNMFFMKARSGALLSEFRIPRSSQNPGTGGYCSSHLGNVVPSKHHYLLANAYYGAGSSVIDFTDPRNPQEVAYGDREGAGTWSTYWYESSKRHKREDLDVYANDGVGNAAANRNGFEAWTVTLGTIKRNGLPYLNPQTQERIIGARGEGRERRSDRARSASGRRTKVRTNKGRYAKGKAPTRSQSANDEVADHLATD